MDDSRHEIEVELHEMLGRLKHARYMPNASIEGLTPSESNVLMAIDRFTFHGGRAPRPGHIGGDLHLSPSALSQLLKSLEEKDLITRERAADDSRGVVIILTPAGLQKAELGRRYFREQINAIEAYLGEDDLRALLAILRKIDTYFQQQVAEGKATELPPHHGGGLSCG